MKGTITPVTLIRHEPIGTSTGLAFVDWRDDSAHGNEAEGSNPMNTKPWPILTDIGLDTAALSTPLRARKPRTYTVGDVFALPPEQCAAVFGVMAATPQHRYVVEAGPVAAGWLAWYEGDSGAGASAHVALYVARECGAPVSYPDDDSGWPLPNVHLSTPPCSTQAELDERAPWALRCPAAARVLLLVPTERLDVRSGFDLVTLRGGTAPLHPDWVRSVRDQCDAAGVAFRFDGWGDFLPVEQMTDEQYAALDACDAGLVDFGQRPWGESGPCVYAMRRGRSGRLLDGATHDGEVPPC